jgi:hypothetical protein
MDALKSASPVSGMLLAGETAVVTFAVACSARVEGVAVSKGCATTFLVVETEDAMT